MGIHSWYALTAANFLSVKHAPLGLKEQPIAESFEFAVPACQGLSDLNETGSTIAHLPSIVCYLMIIPHSDPWPSLMCSGEANVCTILSKALTVVVDCSEFAARECAIHTCPCFIIRIS